MQLIYIKMILITEQTSLLSGGKTAGPQLESIPWWGKNISREQTHVWEGGQKYTKYNRINNNLEN